MALEGTAKCAYMARYYRKNKDRLLTSNAERVRRYQKRHPERVKQQQRHAHLRRRYKISLAEYRAMLEKQGGVCAICGKTPEENGKELAVDHDHERNVIRQLLCDNCNKLIGHAKESIATLLKAAEYIRRHALLYTQRTFTCPAAYSGTTEQQWDLAFLSKEEFMAKYQVNEEQYQALAEGQK